MNKGLLKMSEEDKMLVCFYRHLKELVDRPLSKDWNEYYWREALEDLILFEEILNEKLQKY